MQTTMLILQILLGAVFTGSGIAVYLLRNRLPMSWLKTYSPNSVFLICFMKLLGGAGLILPLIFTFPRGFILLPASGIALLMLFAARYHLKHREYKDIPANVILLAISMTLIIHHLRFFIS